MKAKKIFLYALKLSITALVLWWIDRSIGFSTVVDTLSKTNFAFFAVAVFIYVVSIFIGALQWRIILKNRGLSMRVFETVKLYWTGMFFNNFVLGSLVGDSFKVAALYRQKKARQGFGATFLDRFAGLAVLSIFAIIGAPITNSAGILLLFWASILIALLLIIFSKRLGMLLSRLSPNVQKIISSVHIDRQNKADTNMLGKVFAVSVLIQSLRISSHIFCAAAVGIFTFDTLHYYFVIIPITALLMMIPLPFGVVPTISGAIFAAAGFSTGDATIMQFLATIAAVIGSSAGAVFFILGRTKIR